MGRGGDGGRGGHGGGLDGPLEGPLVLLRKTESSSPSKNELYAKSILDGDEDDDIFNALRYSSREIFGKNISFLIISSLIGERATQART